MTNDMQNSGSGECKTNKMRDFKDGQPARPGYLVQHLSKRDSASPATADTGLAMEMKPDSERTFALFRKIILARRSATASTVLRSSTV